MVRRKKLRAWIIVTVVIVAVIGAGTIVKYVKEHKAVQMAQEYLSQKYEQEMQYETIWFSWIDPSLYHVYFSPVDGPEMFFEVLVQQDLTISPEWRNKYGDFFSSDNYHTAYFEYMMEDFFSSDIQRVWGADAYITVRVPDGAIYAFKMSEELNDKMHLNEMEELIGEYLFLIDTNQIMEGEEAIKTREANKIIEFISVVQKSGYSPSRIVFWYDVPKSKQNKDGRDRIGFDDWAELDTVDQIASRIDKGFFS